MNKMKAILGTITLGLVIATTSLAAVAQPVLAQTPEQSACEGSGGTWANGTCTHGTRTLPGTARTIGNILVFITGAVSVIMVILGGFRYAVSNGDQGNITSAKNTILYAIIGVIIAIAAYAIINFVLSSI
jgi:hypothetical protein